MVENLLAHHCTDVLQRFVELGMTANEYIWPLLRSSFSDVFPETEWLRVWDNVVSNHPGFAIYIAVAYLKASQVCVCVCVWGCLCLCVCVCVCALMYGYMYMMDTII